MSDVVSRMSAAVGSLCACPCRQPITDESPATFFAGEKCQQRWHALRTFPPAAVHMAGSAAQHLLAALKQLGERLAEILRPLLERLAVFVERIKSAQTGVTHLRRALRPPARPGLPPGWTPQPV